MNSAFMNLAKNDEDLIQEIKTALINMSEQAAKRDTLYLAIEHNARYLCEMTKTANTRCLKAENENASN